MILVESISPLENRHNHEEWESLLVDRGYLFAAFDGINRFYVPVEHAELIEALAYPISVLDRYESADVVSERSRASLQLERQNELEQENEVLRSDLSTLREDRSRLEQELHQSALEIRKLAVSRDQATAELRGDPVHCLVATDASFARCAYGSAPPRTPRSAGHRRATGTRCCWCRTQSARRMEVDPVLKSPALPQPRSCADAPHSEPADRLRPQARRGGPGASPTSPAPLTSSSSAPRMSSCSADSRARPRPHGESRAGCRAPATRDPDATRAVAGRTSLSPYAGVRCHAADTRRHRTRPRARGEGAGLWRGRTKSRTVRTS